jgi:polygalacturonase
MPWPGMLSAFLKRHGLYVRDVRRPELRRVGRRRRLDADAVNAAIKAASKVGGGRVIVPAGRYLCFSIRLASHVHLRLEAGAVIVAADPALHAGAYDPPEPNPYDLYQDFGHSHWRNSLIWGDGVEDVVIDGPGLIDGTGLTREGPGSRWTAQSGEFPLSMAGLSAEEMAVLVPERAAMVGQGNKAIALKNCRGVTLRDFTILKGGHFAILATGCQDLTIEGLRIDTDRDGIDIDCCRAVRIAGCQVNTPNDDAIVLKSSLALGEPVFTKTSRSSTARSAAMTWVRCWTEPGAAPSRSRPTRIGSPAASSWAPRAAAASETSASPTAGSSARAAWRWKWSTAASWRTSPPSDWSCAK